MSAGQPFSFHAADGAPLAGTLFTAAQATHRPVLLAGALAVPQRFYAPFAQWLALQGRTVLTFDLRGMGQSRQPRHRRSLRGLQADMLSWARQDFAAAVATLAAHGGAQVDVLGHSLGLHHALMTTQAAQAHIAHAVGVASGARYWRDWAAPSRRLAPLMFHLAGPLSVPLFGYFPGRRLGMVGDLPAGVMRQWSRWCRHPGFAWGAEPEAVLPSLQAARFPITAFSISDDESMTQACTQALLRTAPNARSTLHRITPRAHGLAAIGHLGAFRPAAAALWPLLLQALDAPAVEAGLAASS